MKLLLPIAFFAAAVAAAECEAESIVESCLESETKKFEACSDTEYDCQCAAQEAIATYVSLLTPSHLIVPFSPSHLVPKSHNTPSQTSTDTPSKAATTTAPTTTASSRHTAR